MEFTNPKLKVNHFSFFYGNFEALHDVSVEIPSRQITAIIGPSGCGKSTFLRSFNRMNDLIPSARAKGQILLDDQDLYSVDVVELRKRIGMVFQRPNPFPKSIFDNVAFGPRAHGLHDRRTVEGIVERSLRDAALWDDVKDNLGKSGL